MTQAEKILSIINGSLVFVTFGLVIVTYLYTRATKKMADSMDQQSRIMQKEFEIRLMPLIEERISKRVTASPKATADLIISNKGFYPVFCTDVEIKLINKNNKDDFVIEHMSFLQWLEGGREITREISFDFGRLSSFSGNQNILEKATVIMTFNYRSISNTEIHHLQFVDY